MSETLWYYTVTVEHTAKIMQDGMIFEPDRELAWFTSDDDYRIADEGQRHRIGVSRKDESFRSYEALKRLGKVDLTDQIKAANSYQWFGTSLPVSSDKWTSVEKLTNEGWTRLTEPEKQWLRDFDLRRDVQKTLEKS
jgi:hypothetical protein